MKRKDSYKIESTTAESGMNTPADAFLTAEGIELKQTYPEQDIENIKHLDFEQVSHPIYAGLMQRCAPTLTVRQYAGFSTAEEKAMLLQTKLGCWSKGSLDCTAHRGIRITTRDVGKQELRLTLWKT
jgi:methylmalonyl-CoA mutase